MKKLLKAFLMLFGITVIRYWKLDKNQTGDL